jgi:hypothetical protein
MLKSAASKKYHHNKALKHRPTNEKDWRLMNQAKQAPDIYNKRVANMELRRLFLEGQNIRNNASEKQRLTNILNNHNVNNLQAGRYRNRIAQIDGNPANRSYLQQNPILAPIIGAQPHYAFI